MRGLLISERHPRRRTIERGSSLDLLGTRLPRAQALSISGVESQVAQLDWTPCHFGGARPWFRCPFPSVAGAPCGRRVRVLYLPRGAREFGCRHCHRLTYRSRQLHRDPWYEGFERPQRAFARLARAMHPRTSARRLERALRRAEATLPAMDALLRSVSRR